MISYAGPAGAEFRLPLLVGFHGFLGVFARIIRPPLGVAGVKRLGGVAGFELGRFAASPEGGKRGGSDDGPKYRARPQNLAGF